jgi:hypothetical protein
MPEGPSDGMPQITGSNAIEILIFIIFNSFSLIDTDFFTGS